MLQKFQTHIKNNKLFSKEDKLILGISGGEDSVVLAYLLKESGFNFALAHVNFNLRGKDSKADERFCKALAKKLKLELHVKLVDVKAYCKAHKVNIQLAARNLRYDWFNELLKESQSQFLLTAHHLNDSIETQFINLIRGTGIKGLKGIPEKGSKVVRPLLHFKKAEIASYAKKNKITSRLDKSNLEDKYQRNFIRLQVIPKLKKLNPQLEQTFLSNTQRFQEESAIIEDYLEAKSKELVSPTEDGITIHKSKLKKAKYPSTLLHSLLSGYGFNESQRKSILQNILSNGLSGKSFYSNTHHLTIERTELLLKKIVPVQEHDFIIKSLNDFKTLKKFKLSPNKAFIIPNKNELYLNPTKLIYPLTVRHKQTGDKFKPFGMKGFKLVSDFMKDQKLSVFEKEKCRLLVNGNDEIIWVIQYRSDERYRVNPNESKLIKLTYLD